MTELNNKCRNHRCRSKDHVTTWEAKYLSWNAWYTSGPKAYRWRVAQSTELWPSVSNLVFCISSWVPACHSYPPTYPEAGDTVALEGNIVTQR
jgi:hypothetical protein